jgi:hypothetical protein
MTPERSFEHVQGLFGDCSLMAWRSGSHGAQINFACSAIDGPDIGDHSLGGSVGVPVQDACHD